MVPAAVCTVLTVLSACDSGSLPAASSRPTASWGTDGGTGGVEAAQWAVQRRNGVVQMLDEQGRAVVRRDLKRFLAPVTGEAERRAAQRRFERMALIGLAELHVVSVEEVAPPVPVEPGTPVTWDVQAVFDYRIRDFDRAPRRFALALSVRAAPDRPQDVTVTSSRPADRPQPWDLEGLRVRRSVTSLVLGAGTRLDLDEVLRRADRAAGRVATVWGATVPAVWVVPPDTAGAARLLGRSAGQLDGVAAATDGPLEEGRVAGADRIVLSPDAWSSLRPAGRDVVMTHELTHVAVRASTVRPVPLWLSEGFAEYVAYRFVDLPERAVAAALVTQVRRSGLPPHLPSADLFDPGSGTMSAAYAEAWLAVRELVHARGESAVVRFYRAAAGIPTRTASGSDPETNTDAALQAVLRLSRPELERRWLAHIRSLAS